MKEKKAEGQPVTHTLALLALDFLLAGSSIR